MKIVSVLAGLILCSTQVLASTVDTDVNYKKEYKTGIASDPSYCIGYADAKMFQTGNQQYYEWMKQWYEDQTSNTDLVMKPFNHRSYVNGTEMNNNDLTVECVMEFDFIITDEVQQ
ncbi:hypothetical protein EJP02_422 [Escherichia phage EJP2]|nr:hypothetical protein EJP02_422 [Escherichia phage EJP2]